MLPLGIENNKFRVEETCIKENWNGVFRGVLMEMMVNKYFELKNSSNV